MNSIVDNPFKGNYRQFHRKAVSPGRVKVHPTRDRPLRGRADIPTGAERGGECALLRPCRGPPGGQRGVAGGHVRRIRGHP